jgi:DNA (cytosine-5)-methyltransferase 1
MKSENPHSGFHETNTSRCLDTTSSSPSCNQGGNVIVIQGSMIGRADENGPNGAGLAEDTSFTLTATDRHAVVVEHHPNDSRVNIREDNTVQTLTGRMGTGG